MDLSKVTIRPSEEKEVNEIILRWLIHHDISQAEAHEAIEAVIKRRRRVRIKGHSGTP